MIKPAFTDVSADGGEGNDEKWLVDGGESVVHDFCEGLGECTNAGIFVILNEVGEEITAFSGNKSGGKVLTMWANASRIWSFAVGAEILVVVFDVIFTTIAKWATETPATPTRVGSEELEEARECCIFYI